MFITAMANWYLKINKKIAELISFRFFTSFKEDNLKRADFSALFCFIVGDGVLDIPSISSVR